MIGDPSGKSEERILLSKEEILFNQECFYMQLKKFLDFDCKTNSAEIVNNHDWFKDMKFLDFLRDVGKHLTINYMIAKDSVQQRLESGLSFTEFSYQLLQGYDFYWLNMNKNCILQMGGSDQWGNITSGAELIRRKSGNEVHALTCPLVTKSDGTKFGKSAAGEKIWLDPEMTSPYKFYQFWLNCTDEEARRYLKIFSMLPEKEVTALEMEHAAAPHLRPIQKALAKDVTIRVHSETDYNHAVEASAILFGQGTTETLNKLSEKDFLDIFAGVARYDITSDQLDNGINVIKLLCENTCVFASKSEARRMIESNGLNINRKKVDSLDYSIQKSDLLNGKYLLVQKGKKNYYLIKTI